MLVCDFLPIYPLIHPPIIHMYVYIYVMYVYIIYLTIYLSSIYVIWLRTQLWNQNDWVCVLILPLNWLCDVHQAQ